jgi:hypothetical protein
LVLMPCWSTALVCALLAMIMATTDVDAASPTIVVLCKMCKTRGQEHALCIVSCRSKQPCHHPHSMGKLTSALLPQFAIRVSRLTASAILQFSSSLLSFVITVLGTLQPVELLSGRPSDAGRSCNGKSLAMHAKQPALNAGSEAWWRPYQNVAGHDMSVSCTQVQHFGNNDSCASIVPFGFYTHRAPFDSHRYPLGLHLFFSQEVVIAPFVVPGRPCSNHKPLLASSTLLGRHLHIGPHLADIRPPFSLQMLFTSAYGGCGGGFTPTHSS